MFIQPDTDLQSNHKASTSSRRRSLLRDESGQSIIVVAIALFAIVGFTALAIDVATWYQRHHQAQVAADAAALAAANCLAYASTSGQTCTSTTDTTDAINVATNYAKNNGVTIPASDVSFDNPTYPAVVTVTVPNTSPALFAGIFGIGTTTQTAKSAATFKDTGSTCATAGAGCQLIFANDRMCPGGGVTINTNGTGNSAAINGGVQSNGSITTNSTGNPTYNSTPTYSNGTGCTGPSTSSPTAPWNTKGVTEPVPKNWPNDWPVDYRSLYPPCVLHQTTYSPLFGAVTCNSSNTPSYCDQTAPTGSYSGATSLTSSSTPNQIYCAPGTSTTPEDPSTWNGAITLTGPLMATLIGGTVSVNSSGNVAGGAFGPKPGNNLWIYAAQTGSALTVTLGGNSTATGSMFAPAGTANVTVSGTPSGGGIFIEGYDVNYTSNGNPSASGPLDTSSGAPPTVLYDSLLN